MLRITINIKPTTNTVTNVENTTPTHSRPWVKIVTWGGATAATIAVIADILEILDRLGII